MPVPLDAALTPAALVAYVLDRYAGVVEVASWGERSLFLNPDGTLPRGVYFVTIKEADGPNDRASHLDRPGVYRLNFSVRRSTFERLFGSVPARPSKGGVVATGHDFTALDTLVPHPVYGWMRWLSVLNPSPATFERLAPLLDEAHELAAAKLAKRLQKR